MAFKILNTYKQKKNLFILVILSSLIIIFLLFVLFFNSKDLKIDLTDYQKNIVYKIGDDIPNYKSNIKAINESGNDVTSSIIIDDSNVKWEIFGKYYIYYSYKNKVIAITIVEVIYSSPFFINYVDLIFYLDMDSSINYFATNIRAFDCYGKDITYDSSGKRKITVDDSNVDYSKIGKYIAYYEITDPNGNYKKQEITVDIRKNSPTPVIYGISDNLYLKLNTSSNQDVFLEGVKAYSNQGNDITKSVKVNVDNLNYSIPGEYIISYEVIDNNGNYSSFERMVIILNEDIPSIFGIKENIVLNVGEKLPDWTNKVRAYDLIDKNITNELIIKVVNLKTNIIYTFDELKENLIHEIGEYNLIYEVTSSIGKTITEEVYLVIWIDVTKPTITEVSDLIYIIGNDYPDLLDGIRAYKKITDKLVIELTDRLQVTLINPDNQIEEIDISNIDYNSIGNYVLVYTVTDDSGNTGKIRRNLLIVDTETPILYNLPDQFIYLIDEENPQEIPDYKNGVIAWDLVDGDLTSLIEILECVDYTIEGIYEVTYKVSDFNGNTVIAKVNVIVSK